MWAPLGIRYTGAKLDTVVSHWNVGAGMESQPSARAATRQTDSYQKESDLKMDVFLFVYVQG